MTYKQLREVWPECGAAIESLEKEGKILVLRSDKTAEGKEGAIKSVFWDEIGKVERVDASSVDVFLLVFVLLVLKDTLGYVEQSSEIFGSP